MLPEQSGFDQLPLFCRSRFHATALPLPLSRHRFAEEASRQRFAEEASRQRGNQRVAV